MGYTEHEEDDSAAMEQEEYSEYLLKHENFIRCARCINLIHSSNKYCQYCGCPNEKETFDMEFHDLELMILDAERRKQKNPKDLRIFPRIFHVRIVIQDICRISD